MEEIDQASGTTYWEWQSQTPIIREAHVVQQGEVAIREE